MFTAAMPFHLLSLIFAFVLSQLLSGEALVDADFFSGGQRGLSADDARVREKPTELRLIDAESNKTAGVEVKVLQQHNRAPVEMPPEGAKLSQEQALLLKYNFVTVEYSISEEVEKQVGSVGSILLRLPVRYRENGYQFFTGHDDATVSCHAVLKTKQKNLPNDPDEAAINLAGDDMEIASCSVSNDMNNDTARPHRSAVVVALKEHVQQATFAKEGRKWYFISFLIKNPPITPPGRGPNGEEGASSNKANSFQVELHSTSVQTGEPQVLAKMSFEAMDIIPVWQCGYTDFILSSVCDAQCGGGIRWRKRRRLHSPPKGLPLTLQVHCDEDIWMKEECNVQPCDVNCELGEWTAWPTGSCSKKCGGGFVTERTEVIVGPSGNGARCPNWDEVGVRVRADTTPCNDKVACKPTCTESALTAEFLSRAAIEKKAKPAVLGASAASLANSADAEPATSAASPGAEPAKSSPAEASEASPAASPAAPASSAEASPESSPAEKSPQESAEAASTPAASSASSAPSATDEEEGEKEDEAPSRDAATSSSSSFLALGSVESSLSSRSLTAPRLAPGVVKSPCSKPCGGGRRKVVLPSKSKDVTAETCEVAFEEPCNTFVCKPLMFAPGHAWQYPVAGEWFLLEITFVIEELAQSLAFSAPAGFEFATTGETAPGTEDACLIVEHSLNSLLSCNIYAGSAQKMILNFSHALEPQNAGNPQRDWYTIKTWIKHPDDCSGAAENGACRGEAGQRDWVLTVFDELPEHLWEHVTASYDYFKDETSARQAIEKREQEDVSCTDPNTKKLTDCNLMERATPQEAPASDSAAADRQTPKKAPKDSQEQQSSLLEAGRVSLESLSGGKLHRLSSEHARQRQKHRLSLDAAAGAEAKGQQISA